MAPGKSLLTPRQRWPQPATHPREILLDNPSVGGRRVKRVRCARLLLANLERTRFPILFSLTHSLTLSLRRRARPPPTQCSLPRPWRRLHYQDRPANQPGSQAASRVPSALRRRGRRHRRRRPAAVRGRRRPVRVVLVLLHVVRAPAAAAAATAAGDAVVVAASEERVVGICGRSVGAGSMNSKKSGATAREKARCDLEETKTLIC